MPSLVRVRSWFVLTLGAVLGPMGAQACGGSSAPPPSAARSAPAAAAETPATDDSASTDDEPEPAGPRCDDGTCFACGDGFCPRGFYCEERKSGQQARGCAWIPRCASRASCGCLNALVRTSAGCSCEEKSGGVYLTCESG